MKKIILDIEGMTCSACSNGLEKYLKKQKGITDAYVNLIMATAMIEYDEILEMGVSPEKSNLSQKIQPIYKVLKGSKTERTSSLSDKSG